MNSNFKYMTMLGIMFVVSMISEDTGESSQGVKTRLLQECEFYMSSLTLFMVGNGLQQQLTVGLVIRCMLLGVIGFYFLSNILVVVKYYFKNNSGMQNGTLFLADFGTKRVKFQ